MPRLNTCQPNRSLVIRVLAILFLVNGSLQSQETDWARVGRAVMAAVEFSPDGKSLISASQDGVFRHAKRGDEPVKIGVGLDNVNVVAFSPRQDVLAIAGGSVGETGTIHLRSWPDLEEIYTYTGYRDVITDIVWLNEETIVAASADHSIGVLNVKHGTIQKKIEEHSGPVLTLALSPDGKLLCSAGVDQTIRVWDTSNWSLVRTLNNHLGTVHDLAFRPARAAESTQTMLASASEDETVRIWYPAIGRMVRIIRHPVAATCIEFCPDGSMLYSGSKDGCVRFLEGQRQAIARTVDLESGWIMSLTTRDTEVVAGTADGKIKTVRDHKNLER